MSKNVKTREESKTSTTSTDELLKNSSENTTEPVVELPVKSEPVYGLGNLPENLSGLQQLIITTEREIAEIDEKIDTISRELKPQSRIEGVTSKAKGNRSVGTTIARKALKLELQELKDSKLPKRELVETAKERFEILLEREKESSSSNRLKVKGLSTYYTKRNMSKISVKVFKKVDSLYATHKPELLLLKQSANKKDTVKIYSALTEFIRKHDSKLLPLITGSDAVKVPIYNAINQALLNWDGKKPLTLAIDIKGLKRKNRGK